MSEIQNMTKEELIELLKSDMQKWNNFRKESIWPPNLRGANLEAANLRGANLRGANLRGANLRGANLRGANLRGADLRGANLRGAKLWSANLEAANLRGANLEGANLRNANLRGANLEAANLRGANLRGANLENLEHINVNSHDLLAEFLRRSAEDDWQKRSIAGLILVSRDWCYKDLLKLPVPEELKQWAIEVLSKYPDFKDRLERE